jgi:hypothetical protein
MSGTAVTEQQIIAGVERFRSRRGMRGYWEQSPRRISLMHSDSLTIAFILPVLVVPLKTFGLRNRAAHLAGFAAARRRSDIRQVRRIRPAARPANQSDHHRCFRCRLRDGLSFISLLVFRLKVLVWR